MGARRERERERERKRGRRGKRWNVGRGGVRGGGGGELEYLEWGKLPEERDGIVLTG